MKKMLYVNQSDKSSYDVDINPDRRHVTIYYGEKDPTWHSNVQGTEAAWLSDTGNGVMIRFNGETPFTLDYSQLAHLEMLITALNQDAPWTQWMTRDKVARYELKED